MLRLIVENVVELAAISLFVATVALWAAILCG